MKNSITLGKLLGAAFVISLAAGCGNNAANDADGTPDSIESPVMSKQDDQAIAGSDTTANSTANAVGNSTTGATDMTDNSATGATDTTANSAMGTTDTTANSATGTADTTANSTMTAPATP